VSKRPGKIEKALEAIFAASDEEFTTKQLTWLVYSGRAGTWPSDYRQHAAGFVVVVAELHAGADAVIEASHE
jgi:hypothetical protein